MVQCVVVCCSFVQCVDSALVIRMVTAGHLYMVLQCGAVLQCDAVLQCVGMIHIVIYILRVML